MPNSVYLWCSIASNHIVYLIRSVNTGRNAARRLKEEVAHAGSTPHDEQVPPHEENANVDQAPDNFPPMTEVEMRVILT